MPNPITRHVLIYTKTKECFCLAVQMYVRTVADGYVLDPGGYPARRHLTHTPILVPGAGTAQDWGCLQALF